MVNRRSGSVKGADRAGPQISVSGENELRGIRTPPKLGCVPNISSKVCRDVEISKTKRRFPGLPPPDGYRGGFRAVLGSPGGRRPLSVEGTTWNHGTNCAPKAFVVII